VALLRPGAAVGLRVLGFGARMIDVLTARFVFVSLWLHLRALPQDGALNEFSRVAFRKKVYRSIAASSGTLALRQNPDAELPGCHPDDEGKMLVPRNV
jgi:hypothetical protein